MERAVAYIRVSDPRQVVDGNSLVSQEELVRAYATSKDYELISVWKEEGETAKTDDRKVLQELLKSLATQREKVNVLIVPKIDRFARDVGDYTALKGRLYRLGIRLESVGERIENTPVGRFTEMVLASVAQFDNEIRAERSKGGMIQAVTEGRWVWIPPAGYRSVRIGTGGRKGGRGTIEPHPKDSELIRACFERIAHGARQIDVHRWLALRGLRISFSAFGRMLRNEVYVGRIRSFGRVFEAQPPFVPIVPNDLFLEVQLKLRGGSVVTRPYERDNEDFPLRGTVRCSCGNYLTASWSHGSGGKYAYYRCRSCPNVNIRKETLESGFAVLLRSFETPDGWSKALEEVLQRQWELRSTDRELRRSEFEAEVRETRHLQDSLGLKVAEGVVPDSVAKRQFDILLEREAFATQNLALLSKTGGESTELVNFSGEFLGQLSEFWARERLEIRKKLQKFLFPEGISFEDVSRFRTSEYPLLEQMKSLISSPGLRLVQHSPESANALLEWISALHRTFRDHPAEVSAEYGACAVSALQSDL